MFFMSRKLTDAELLDHFRKLSATAWPRWWRAGSTVSPMPRHIMDFPAERPEMEAIRILMGRRMAAYTKKRLGEAELLETRAREKLAELVKNKPPGVEQAIRWIEACAEGFDLLKEHRANYRDRLRTSGIHEVIGVADQLFAHCLAIYAEAPNADHAALARRMADCKPAVRMASQDGPPPCPLGTLRKSEGYDAQAKKARDTWHKKHGKRHQNGSYGVRAGSRAEARQIIKQMAETPPDHIADLMDRLKSQTAEIMEVAKGKRAKQATTKSAL
jgi:hypothetical protein